MLPDRDRLLLGPGPSPVSPRVMASLTRPMRSHLDPDLLAVLDDLRARLSRVLRAVADAVTSLGALPFDMSAWDIDACYACSQKGLGAPPGLSPVAFAPRALRRAVPSRSFAFDATLLDDIWTRHKYHHTISAPLVWALHTALSEVEEEGLETRWQRHEATHHRFVEALALLGLRLWPPAPRVPLEPECGPGA